MWKIVNLVGLPKPVFRIIYDTQVKQIRLSPLKLGLQYSQQDINFLSMLQPIFGSTADMPIPRLKQRPANLRQNESSNFLRRFAHIDGFKCH